MRSLEHLRSECTRNGVEWREQDSSVQLMDKLRDFYNAADADMQLDPQKAYDLSDQIDWGQPEPFKRISKYFGSDYAMEPKLDGARMRLFIGEGLNRMNTGRRSDKTFAYIERSDNFPHFRDLDMSEFAGTVIDGEIMAPKQSITTETGTVTKGWLNSAVALTNVNSVDAVKIQEREGKARFYAFDIIRYKGEDITGEWMSVRRELLARLYRDVMEAACENLFLLPQYASAEDVIHTCLAQGHEGVMIKTLRGPYEAGKRSRHWLKVKQASTADVVIMDYVPGKGRNEGLVGALRCGVYRDGQLLEVSQPGAFDDAFRRELSMPDGSLRPEWVGRVVEVIAQGVTKNGKMRHPRLVRLRDDKVAEECTFEQLAGFAEV